MSPTTSSRPVSTTASPDGTALYDSPPRVRRLAGAACMPALFLAMLATGPLDPFEDTAGPAVQLGQAVGHVGAVRALGFVELMAAALAFGVVLAFAGLTRGRGRGLGNAGAVLGIAGALGMSLVAVHHWFLAALVGAPHPVALHTLDRLDGLVGPVLPLLMIAMPAALVVLAGAGLRAGFVPVPAFWLTVAFFVTEWVPGLPDGEVVQLLVGLVAFTWIAVGLLRTARTAAVPAAAAA